MEIYFARHGESMGNVKDPSAGDDPPLTARGFLQAKLLGERLANVRFDAFFSSPLIRAVSTANAVMELRAPAPVYILSDLMETGTRADYPGLPLEELRRLCPLADYVDGAVTFPLGEETPLMHFERAVRAVDLIKNTCPGAERILIVAHGMFMRRLLCAALGLDGSPPFFFSHENTGLSMVRYSVDDGVPRTRLVFSNDTSHLYHGVRTDRYN